MAVIIYTVEEYIATKRKKDTIWMVFNSAYNKVHALKQKFEAEDDDLTSTYLDPKYTNEEKQKEFLEYMAKNHPDTEVLPVFDLVSVSYLVWKYLGSYAIDADVGSEVYEALSKKYGDPYGEVKDVEATLWLMNYDDAKKFHKDREDMLDDEFGNSDDDHDDELMDELEIFLNGEENEVK